MDVICVYFCLIETKYYRIATSVLLWWFEVSKRSCPLKSFSAENIGQRPKLSRRKGGDRRGLTTVTHCFRRHSFIHVSVQNHNSCTGFWKTLNQGKREHLTAGRQYTNAGMQHLRAYKTCHCWAVGLASCCCSDKHMRQINLGTKWQLLARDPKGPLLWGMWGGRFSCQGTWWRWLLFFW